MSIAAYIGEGIGPGATIPLFINRGLGIGAVVIPVDVGLSYTLDTGRAHYVLGEMRAHYTLRDMRAHWRLPDDD